MRAYELMIIVDGALDDQGVDEQVKWVAGQVESRGATIASTDRWGRRRFAYEIDHKTEGYYTVYEFTAADGDGLDALERALRLADGIVRHKLVRLPDSEAARRGLSGEAAPASAG